MITPLLESAILQGKGAFKTYVFGASQLGVIEAPANKTIIITDFFYYPVVPLKSVEAENFAVDQVLSTLQFSSSKGVYNYTYKNVIIGENFVPNQVALQIQTYQVHSERIFIRILCFNPLVEWTNIKGDIEPIVNEVPSPLGFAKEIPQQIIKKITWDGDYDYIPQILNRDEVFATGSHVVSQFTPPVQPANTPDLDTTAWTSQTAVNLPVLNIHYVELDKDFSNDLSGSR